MENLSKISRRKVVQSIGAASFALAAPSVWNSSRAANTLTIADGGGIYTKAWTEGYYQPFLKETGVEVIPIERRDNPAAEIRATVETKTYSWDLCASIGQDVAYSLTKADYLEELDLSGPDTANIPDNMKMATYIGSDVLAIILACRTDKVSRPVKSFSDLWETEKLPGRRGMRKYARDSISIALVADGVAPADISKVLQEEAGWKRAFEKLDVIKPQIAIWWESAPQTPTLLQTAELDICAMPSSRAQTVIDAGSPVSIGWGGGFYFTSGWVIPKGSPKVDLARQFISFCSKPENQAAACNVIGLGPTNPNAFQFVDAERAKSFPTYEANFAQMGPVDFVFWGQRGEEAGKRFNEWLLT